MNPARTMGTFLRVWKSQRAGLNRGQMAMAVSAQCGKGRETKPGVVLAWVWLFLAVLQAQGLGAGMSMTDPANDTTGPGYADIVLVTATQTDARTLRFTMQLREAPPADLTGYCAFIWGLDTDLNPGTGLPVNDQGNDYHIRLYKDTNWNPDWHVAIDNIAAGTAQLVGVAEVNGNSVAADVDLLYLGNPSALHLVASTIPTAGAGDVAPNTGHGSLSITPLPPDATEVPAVVTIYPPLTVLSMEGPTTGQLALHAYNAAGQELPLEGKRLQFSGSDAHVIVDATGHVTALGAQPDANVAYLWGSVNGVGSGHAAVVRVLHHQATLEYEDLRGQYVWYYLLKAFDTCDFDAVWQQYDMVHLTDLAYLEERDLTTTTPNPNGPQWVVCEPGEGPTTVSGASGNPVRIGIDIDKPCPYNNCIRDASGRPHTDVVWHELGHDFTYASQPWAQLYGGIFNHSEGWATLCGQYALHRLATIGPAQYGLSGDPLESVQWWDNVLQTQYLNALQAYEAGGCVYSTVTPDIIDGILTRLANQYGWGIYRDYFRLLGPPSAPWALLDEVRALGKTDTFTCCALGIIAGADLRPQFKAWSFPIDDAYYDTLRTQLLPHYHKIIADAGIVVGQPSVRSSGTLAASLQAEDTLGHPLNYAWVVMNGDGTPVGSFADGDKASAVWTAPRNGSSASTTATLGCTVSCGSGRSIQPQLTISILPEGDVTSNGSLDVGDLTAFGGQWLKARAGDDWDHAADLDGDGDLGATDAAVLLDALLRNDLI